MSAVSLDALMIDIAAGDRRAFTSLYELTAPRILGLVIGILVSRPHSEEVRQEVYLTLWLDAHKFDPERGTALSWMLTIARRKAIDRVRGTQAAYERDRRVGRQDLDRCVSQVGDAIEARELETMVRTMVAELTYLQGQAISMLYLDGMSRQDIAVCLGVPTGTVESA